MLSAAGGVRNGSTATAMRPAPVATRIMSRNLSRPDLMAPFQQAWRQAPSSTARSASLGMDEVEIVGGGTANRRVARPPRFRLSNLLQIDKPRKPTRGRMPSPRFSTGRFLAMDQRAARNGD